MATIRPVLIDKFANLGNPFISLAATFTAAVPTITKDQSPTKKQVSNRKNHANRNIFQDDYKPLATRKQDKHYRKNATRSSLRSLTTGTSDFSMDNRYFVHIVDFLDEIGLDSIDLRQLSEVESQSGCLDNCTCQLHG